MQKWEYLVVSLTYGMWQPDQLKRQEELNRYGEEGWELISPDTNNNNNYIFKRPKA